MMELPTVEMDREQATKRFQAYRRALRDRHSAEDEAMARAYKALAAGETVVNLTEAIRGGGTVALEVTSREYVARVGRYVDETYEVEAPRISLARADTRWCWTFGIRSDGSVHLRTQHRPHQRNKRDLIDLPKGTFPSGERRICRNEWNVPGLRAMVPSIPPELRPDGKLDRFHILWEAEWERDTAVPPPPVDPALLRHLGGDLYSVIAVWDLTEVEQLVLAGRQVEAIDRGPGA
jgi:hypothetical protein